MPNEAQSAAREGGATAAKKSISLPPDLLAAAEKRAREERRSLSNYVQSLIDRDLKQARESAAEAA